jgi:hypothetical protein
MCHQSSEYSFRFFFPSFLAKSIRLLRRQSRETVLTVMAASVQAQGTRRRRRRTRDRRGRRDRRSGRTAFLRAATCRRRPVFVLFLVTFFSLLFLFTARVSLSFRVAADDAVAGARAAPTRALRVSVCVRRRRPARRGRAGARLSPSGAAVTAAAWRRSASWQKKGSCK